MSVRPLTPDLAEKARVELNEDPKRLPGDIQHLKDWLAKQPHLKTRTDDQWLVAFLRGCKFSLERTKEKFDLYYTIQSTAPDMFSIDHKHPKFFEILDLGVIILIPGGEDVTKPRISLVRPGAYDPDKYNILEIMSVSHYLQKIVMWEDDQAIVSGIRTVLDLNNVTMTHFLQMTPMVMKKMVVSGQDATPFRLKGTHYLNTPPGFEVVFNAIKGLLNEKNKSRLYVHNKNYEEMYKVIPKDHLPAEYGGNAGTIQDITNYWKYKVQEYSALLDEELQYGTDESKRPGKPKTAETLFGIEGSFRQLEFD
nr:alpha-tocopherol transfer protein-like [Plodia interpunctella]